MNAKKYFFRITTLIIVTLILVVSVFFWFSSKSVLDLYRNRTQSDLQAQGVLLRKIAKSSIDLKEQRKLQDFCQEMGDSLSVRLTFIDTSGKVIADNYSNSNDMQNHANREEVAEILKHVNDKIFISTSNRYSSTLQQNMVYIAMNCSDKNGEVFVLRLAVSVASMHNFLQAVHNEIIFVAVLAVLSTILISYLVLIWVKMPIDEICSKAREIANGNLDCKLEMPKAGAVSDLANSINNMAEQLKYRLNKSLQQGNEREAILSSMLESIVAVNESMQITGINQAACNFFMVKSEEIVNQQLENMTANKKLLKLIQRGLKHPGYLSKELVIKKGEVPHYFRAIVNPLKFNGKERSGVLLALSDITEVKKLENFRSDFIANLSHEIKTPITALLSATEVLNDGAINDQDEAQHFMDIINRHSQRLNALIEDILSLSMLENETIKDDFNLIKAPVGSIIDVSIALCQAKAEGKHITLIKENIDPDIELHVDPQLLEQALINLLTNAIKYSDVKKNVRVIGKLMNEEYHIIVKDSGFGIPKEHLGRLFERFYRVDKARSRSLGGTGLGLAIVKHIIGAHYGRIEVNSEVGVGSEFIIILPMG